MATGEELACIYSMYSASNRKWFMTATGRLMLIPATINGWSSLAHPCTVFSISLFLSLGYDESFWVCPFASHVSRHWRTSSTYSHDRNSFYDRWNARLTPVHRTCRTTCIRSLIPVQHYAWYVFLHFLFDDDTRFHTVYFLDIYSHFPSVDRRCV